MRQGNSEEKEVPSQEPDLSGFKLGHPPVRGQFPDSYGSILVHRIREWCCHPLASYSGWRIGTG